ncbi:MAG: winged helix-turn-helix domain-containing protein [Dehalobacterium sp.]|jgi:molybdate transport system regulatory protein
MEAKYKLWLEKEGKAFGRGPYLLLKGIEDTGSLNRSARRMNMSYSQAHKLIKDIEKRLGFPLIISHAGGHEGGGSQLTNEAKNIMEKFLAFEKESSAAINAAFRKYFD